MFRLLLLAPLFLLLTACQYPAMDGWTLRAAPLASPTAHMTLSAISSAIGGIDRKAQNNANLMGENKPAATITPDFGATQAAEIRADNRRHDDVVLAQKQADAAKAQADKERVDAQNTQSVANQNAVKTSDASHLTKQANEIILAGIYATGTASAPRLEREAADEKALAGNAGFRAAALPTMQAGVGVGAFGIVVLLVLYVLAQWRKAPPVEEPEENPHPEEPSKLVPVPGRPGSSVKRETPTGWSATEMGVFARLVRTPSHTSGIPFSRQVWLDQGMPEKKWDFLNEFCDEKGYTFAVQDNANSTKTWTPTGEVWLSLFISEPLPREEEKSISE